MVEAQAREAIQSGARRGAAVAAEFLVAIASESGHEAGFGIHTTHGVVIGVRDEEIPLRIRDEIVRRDEARVFDGAVVTCRRGFALGGRHDSEHARFRIHSQQAMRLLADEHVVLRIKGDAKGLRDLALSRRCILDQRAATGNDFDLLNGLRRSGDGHLPKGTEIIE